MNIKRNAIFLLDKEKDKPNSKLRYRIKWSGNTVAFNVGYRVDNDKWSIETQRCKINTTHGKKKIAASVINKEINRYEEIAESVFQSYEKENRKPTEDEVRKDFNKALGKEIEETNVGFFNRFDEFIATQGFQNNWKEGTKKQIRTVRNHLQDYDSTMSIQGLTEEKLSGFMRFLLSSGLKNLSIQRNIKVVRWFIRWAYNRGYYNGNIHNTFHPNIKTADKEVVHLTWDELIGMYNRDFAEDQKNLERVRDVFCFCCFTGLRYSDVANLKKSDVKANCISIVTQKTSNALKIELNKYSQDILKRYKDVDLPNNLALPVIVNQKMNFHLKEIGEICDLNEEIRIVTFRGNQRDEEVYKKHELLTTHCGRRTFIVNALYLGIPAEVVMRWTGHSDYNAMKPYVKIVDELKVKEMDKFNLK